MASKIKKIFKEIRRAKRRAKKKSVDRIKDIISALWKMSEWDELVIHRRNLTKLPHTIAVPLWCRKVKRKLSCPEELTIVLIHNYEKEPIMVKSLHYSGIHNFIVLKPKIDKKPWHNSVKIPTLVEYLKSGLCKTPYLLFCDSDDAVLRDDPGKAIQYLHEEDCDLLLANTDYRGGYKYMPQIKALADKIAQDNGYSDLYINTGVYIGRTKFIQQVFEKAMEYVTKNDLSREEYRSRRRDGTLCARLPEFPKGIGCDQVIIRFLHPQFYPKMKIDYAGKLALR
jgi:hypothetical protein